MKGIALSGPQKRAFWVRMAGKLTGKCPKCHQFLSERRPHRCGKKGK